MVMLAVRVGGPMAQNLEVGQVPTPVPIAGEVLVHVDAAGVNPYDLGLVSNRAPGSVLLYPPGRDLAGTVIEGPADLVGSRVWATGGEFGRDRAGFHAEYVALPIAGIRRVPHTLAQAAASTVGVAFTTAWWALTEGGRVDLRPGGLADERVLVTGAAGSVGSAAMQLAAWLGARTIWGYDRAAPSGAIGRVATDSEALFNDVKSAGGSTIVIDAVGAPLLDGVVAATAAGGRIMTMSTPGDGRATFDLRTFYRKGLQLVGVNTGTRDVVANAAVLELLTPAFEAHELHPLAIDSCFPLADAAEAYARLTQNPHGKVLIVNG